MGVITFQFIDTPPLLDVHMFTTSNSPVETEGISIVRGQDEIHNDTVVCILYSGYISMYGKFCVLKWMFSNFEYATTCIIVYNSTVSN